MGGGRMLILFISIDSKTVVKCFHMVIKEWTQVLRVYRNQFPATPRITMNACDRIQLVHG